MPYAFKDASSIYDSKLPNNKSQESRLGAVQPMTEVTMTNDQAKDRGLERTLNTARLIESELFASDYPLGISSADSAGEMLDEAAATRFETTTDNFATQRRSPELGAGSGRCLKDFLKKDSRDGNESGDDHNSVQCVSPVESNPASTNKTSTSTSLLSHQERSLSYLRIDPLAGGENRVTEYQAFENERKSETTQQAEEGSRENNDDRCAGLKCAETCESCVPEKSAESYHSTDLSDIRLSEGHHDSSLSSVSPTSVHAWLENTAKMLEIHLQQRRQRDARQPWIGIPDTAEHDEQSDEEVSEVTEVEVVEEECREPVENLCSIWGLTLSRVVHTNTDTHVPFNSSPNLDAGSERPVDNMSAVQPSSNVRAWLDRSGSLFEEHLRKRQEQHKLQNESDSICDSSNSEADETEIEIVDDNDDELFAIESLGETIVTPGNPSEVSCPKESAFSDPSLPDDCVRDWLEKSATLFEQHLLQRHQQRQICDTTRASGQTHLTDCTLESGQDSSFSNHVKQDSTPSLESSPTTNVLPTSQSRSNSPEVKLSNVHSTSQEESLHSTSEDSSCHESEVPKKNDQPLPSCHNEDANNSSGKLQEPLSAPQDPTSQDHNVRTWLETSAALLEKHIEQRKQYLTVHSKDVGNCGATSVETGREQRRTIDQDSQLAELGERGMSHGRDNDDRSRNNASLDLGLENARTLERKESIEHHGTSKPEHPPPINPDAVQSTSCCGFKDARGNDEKSTPNVREWLKRTGNILDMHLQQRGIPIHALVNDTEDETVIEEILEDIDCETILEAQEYQKHEQPNVLEPNEVASQGGRVEPPSNVRTWLESTARMLEKHLELRQESFSAIEGRELIDYAAEESDVEIEEVESILVDSEHSTSDLDDASSTANADSSTSKTQNVRSWLESTADILEAKLMKRQQRSLTSINHDTDHSNNDSLSYNEMKAAETEESSARRGTLATERSDEIIVIDKALRRQKKVPGSKNLRAWLESTANQLERKIQQRQLDYCKSVHLDAGDEESESDDRSESSLSVTAELASTVSPEMMEVASRESDESPSSTPCTVSGSGSSPPAQGERSVQPAIPAAPYSFSAVSISFLAYNVKTSTAMKVFEEALRILRPGGRVYLVDYDGRTVNKLPSDWRKLLTRVEQFDPIEMQVHGMQEEEIRKILSCMGRSSTRYLDLGYTMARWVGVVPLDFCLF